MINLSYIYPKRGRVMPLTSEKNKILYCLKCGKKDDSIRKYGWLWCETCYIQTSKAPALGDYTVH